MKAQVNVLSNTKQIIIAVIIMLLSKACLTDAQDLASAKACTNLAWHGGTGSMHCLVTICSFRGTVFCNFCPYNEPKALWVACVELAQKLPAAVQHVLQMTG